MMVSLTCRCEEREPGGDHSAHLAKVAAGSGIAALLLWLTYVLLDVQHMNSGFTLPQTSYY